VIKRSGQRGQDSTRQQTGHLTQAEQTVYSEAFKAIENDYQILCSVSEKLREIEQTSRNLGTLDSQRTNDSSTPSDLADGRSPWEICVPLMQLKHNEVLLCKRVAEHGVEYAVIDQLPAASKYAMANGALDILETSDDPRRALRAYLQTERQALELMANDVTASLRVFMAQRFPRQDVSRIVSSITRMCKRVARLDLSDLAEHQAQSQGSQVRA